MSLAKIDEATGSLVFFDSPPPLPSRPSRESSFDPVDRLEPSLSFYCGKHGLS